MNPLVRRLFNFSPYAGLDVRAFPSDLHGWNDHEAMFRRLGADAEVVVEVGAWKGRSTIALARSCPRATILSIDTWLGAKEMWLRKDDPSRYGALRLNHGYPQLYFEFLANMVRAGISERVVPMPMTSTTGLALLADWGIRPDVLYIDGSHDAPDPENDIRAASRLNPGILCGDDYQPGWPDVVAAVDKLVPGFKAEGHFWWRE